MISLAPVVSLFQQTVAALPDGWLKFLMLFVLVFGLGALLTLKTNSKLSSFDYFIWWDK